MAIWAFVFCFIAAPAMIFRGIPVPAATIAPVPGAWTFPPNPPPALATSIPVSLAEPTPNQKVPYASQFPYVFAGTSAYSSVQGNANPLFTPLADLKKRQLSQAIVNGFWNEGLAHVSPLNGNGPVYVVSKWLNPNAPEVTFVANMYGQNRYSGTKVHLPSWALNQCGTHVAAKTSGDCHLEVIDYLDKVDVAGWQCANNGSYGGTPHPGELVCSWGNVTPIGGTGIRSDAMGAVHGGFADGAVVVTPQEIINAENGHPISHALALGTMCLNNPTVYPADATTGSDKVCSKATPGNYPSYGEAVQLVENPSVSLSSHSLPCQAILRAMQTYGAYLSDTGWYTYLFSLSNFVYASDTANPFDPWTTVFAQMQKGGDATGTFTAKGDGSYWSSCLQGLTAADFKIYQIAKP